MKLKRITVGLWLFAGVLGLIAGLRDIFAPGFFNPRTPTTGGIVGQFSIAAVFLILAFVVSRSSQPDGTVKK